MDNTRLNIGNQKILFELCIVGNDKFIIASRVFCPLLYILHQDDENSILYITATFALSADQIKYRDYFISQTNNLKMQIFLMQLGKGII